MKAEKCYFKDEDSTNCYPLIRHIKEAKNKGLKEKAIFILGMIVGFIIGEIFYWIFF